MSTYYLIALFHFFILNARIILNTPAKINAIPVQAMIVATPKAGTAYFKRAIKIIPIASQVIKTKTSSNHRKILY